MRLNKFKITNFKSINDSGWCYLSNGGPTVLAGKNEAGKTSILEALEFFSVGIKGAGEDSYPLHDDKVKPLIYMQFELNKKEIDVITDNAGWHYYAKPLEGMLKKIIVKKSGVGNYRIVDSSQNNEWKEMAVKQQGMAIKDIAPIMSDQLPLLNESFGLPNIEGIDLDAETDLLYETCQNIANQIDEESSVLSKERIEAFQEELNNFCEKFLPFPTMVSLASAIAHNLPRFVLFNSFEDVLPFEIKVKESVDNKPINDLASIAGLDLYGLVEMENRQRRINSLRRHSAQLSSELLSYWDQDEVVISLQLDGENLRVAVRDKDSENIYRVDQRSKGFQWFLSFFLRLQARYKVGESIILIDEPGLYLHAKAQKDVLKVLNAISSNNQVVYTTHSPYLVDANNLGSVRLVIKGDSGTIIENKIHKSADKESLTPIITAIGLDLADSLPFPNKHNLIVEGITDYYYLHAGIVSVGDANIPDVSIVPAKGVHDIHPIISLLIGWGVPFVVLVDSDAAGKREKATLERNFLLDTDKILLLHEQKDISIEDMFSKNDFDRFILCKESTESQKRGAALKAARIDRVIKSKEIYERVRSGDIKFDEETGDNFRELFKRINIVI